MEVQLTNDNGNQFPTVIQSTLVSEGSDEKNYSLTAVMDISHRIKMDQGAQAKDVYTQKNAYRIKRYPGTNSTTGTPRIGRSVS